MASVNIAACLRVSNTVQLEPAPGTDLRQVGNQPVQIGHTVIGGIRAQAGEELFVGNEPFISTIT